MDVRITRTYFRSEIFSILSDELGYLTNQFPDGQEALREAEGAIAEFLNRELRKAYIAGHAEGVQAVMADRKLEGEFSPETDAIWSARKYEDWKNRQ